jgi:SSS family solute:Na+ symporter
MFWKRTTPWGGFYGLVAGILGAGFVWVYAAFIDPEFFRSAFQQAMWMGIVAGAADLVVTVAVSSRTQPLPESALIGLVKGTEIRDTSDTTPVRWFKSPEVLGVSAIALALAMYLLFLFI